MTSRERIKSILHGGIPDRVGIVEGFWWDTIARWQTEGMPKDTTPQDYFGLDWDLIALDTSFQMEEALIKETEEYAVRRDLNGAIARFWKKRTSTPEFLEYPVRSKQDWQRLKKRMVPNHARISVSQFFAFVATYSPQREPWQETVRLFNEMYEQERYTLVFFYFPFESTWRKTGHELLLMTMAEDPAWAEEMFATTADLTIETLQWMLDGGIKPDGIFPNDDIGYRNALLFSPTLYRKLLFPHVKRICEFARSNGIDVIQHSCGDVREAIPMLIEAGVQCLQPLECKAGMDVRRLKEQYGKDIAFMGNIDVRKMEHFDEAEMEEEISSKLTVAKQGGGYVFQSDHSIPATVSLGDYKRTLEIAMKYAWY